MLKTLHLLSGAIYILIFLASGQYMLYNFPEAYQGREEIRMMYRATHIYLFFSAALNLLAAQCLIQFSSYLRVIQAIASWLLLISPTLIFVGFIFEPSNYLSNRPYSYWGVVFSFASVMMFAVLSLPWVRKYSLQAKS